MAHVLVLTLVFPPDAVSTAQIMGELTADLVAGGHRVSVVRRRRTTTATRTRSRASRCAPWWGRLVQRSTLAGAAVYHTAMPQKTASVPKRLLAWAIFHVLSLVVGRDHRAPGRRDCSRRRRR